MATSPLFGWSEPDDTDLVKDGAAAIRTLGNAIDTSMGDLLGGTSGQILSKASNTNMDFTWITNDVGDITEVTAGTGISGGGTSGAVTITNSMATAIDTKGDLIVGTGNDTFTVLQAPITDNTVLIRKSATASGLEWSEDWTTYTPTWSSSGTAPSLGNGTLSGKYLQIGKLVYVQIFFQSGSTTTYGTGDWRLSLPFASYELNGNTSGYPGGGYIEDNGVAGYRVLAIGKSGGASNIALFTSVNAAVTNTSPFTWATNDFFNVQLVYGVA